MSRPLTLWKTSGKHLYDSGRQVVLFRFPQTDQSPGKLRPALVLRKLPGPYDDWLICMISSQLSQQISNFDELIQEQDGDFRNTGLKVPSVARISRLAVVERAALSGSIGTVADERLSRILNRLADWLKGR